MMKASKCAQSPHGRCLQVAVLKRGLSVTAEVSERCLCGLPTFIYQSANPNTQRSKDNKGGNLLEEELGSFIRQRVVFVLVDECNACSTPACLTAAHTPWTKCHFGKMDLLFSSKNVSYKQHWDMRLHILSNNSPG